MIDRPIIFGAPMIRAWLAGAKTQTRRILKPQPPRGDHYGRDIMDWGLSGIYQDDTNSGPSKWWLDVQTDVDDNSHREIDVRYAVGDRLWVRETCRAEELPDGRDGVRYLADNAWLPIADAQDAADAWVAMFGYRGKRGATVPPIHMPRCASRLTLTVTDIKVERLQDISEADARAEGVQFEPSVSADAHRLFVELGGGECCTGFSAVDAYACLWHHIHGVGAWAANPWVVAVSSRPEFRNIDRAAPS